MVGDAEIAKHCFVSGQLESVVEKRVALFDSERVNVIVRASKNVGEGVFFDFVRRIGKVSRKRKLLYRVKFKSRPITECMDFDSVRVGLEGSNRLVESV